MTVAPHPSETNMSIAISNVTTNQTVRLLWTGGWDSTYRLLQLLLLQKKPVETFYVIDSDRLSTGAELRAIQDIKRQLFAKYPATRELLKRTHYREKSDIQPNAEITHSYQNLLDRYFIGGQYEWLARLAHEFNIDDLELCINGVHVGDRWHTALAHLLVSSGADENSPLRISKESAGSDEHTLFKYFRLPTFYARKHDMHDVALKNGFLDIMERTWFCQTPRNLRPCGRCIPCGLTISGGVGWRVPLTSRVRYHLRVTPRLRMFLRTHPRLRAYLHSHQRLLALARHVRHTFRLN